ncbi:hypothetical protein [Parasphingopyxis sp.]|uniref:hypothetical protein n=1 Tax=Parasphingopyxis sp. TaxID=1920299 RepID=UPI0032ECF014
MDEVSVRGSSRPYRRVDRMQPGVVVHVCGRCGCTTQFATLPHIPHDMIGANMNLFDREVLTGVELRYPDGRNWDGASAYGYRRPSEIL